MMKRFRRWLLIRRWHSIATAFDVHGSGGQRGTLSAAGLCLSVEFSFPAASLNRETSRLMAHFPTTMPSLCRSGYWFPLNREGSRKRAGIAYAIVRELRREAL